MATHKRPRGVSLDDIKKCQRIGHAWDDEVGLPPPPSRDRRYVWRYRAMKRCERCTTIDVMGLNDEGKIISHSYDWPEGYKHAKDDPRPSRAELRILFIKANRDIIIRNRNPVTNSNGSAKRKIAAAKKHRSVARKKVVQAQRTRVKV